METKKHAREHAQEEQEMLKKGPLTRVSETTVELYTFLVWEPRSRLQSRSRQRGLDRAWKWFIWFGLWKLVCSSVPLSLQPLSWWCSAMPSLNTVSSSEERGFCYPQPPTLPPPPPPTLSAATYPAILNTFSFLSNLQKRLWTSPVRQVFSCASVVINADALLCHKRVWDGKKYRILEKLCWSTSRCGWDLWGVRCLTLLPDSSTGWTPPSSSI